MECAVGGLREDMRDLDARDVTIRDATEEDAGRIAGLFRAVYGSGYVHPQFYDVHEIKGMIYAENTLVLVAEHRPSGRVVGSAGVAFEMGAYTDLVGEFGRLVVDPAWRGRGLGHALMEERLARVGGRLHVAFVEVRVCAQHSPRISQAAGFVPVGLLPQKLLFGPQREHAALLVRYFDGALALRKNHPRIIPEAYHLAELALTRAGVAPDTIVDEDAAPYPRGEGFGLEELSAEGYSSLLRIERGRLKHREVFGPQRLHYGLFKLQATHSDYLVAHEGSRVVGALGYMTDHVERHVRVFEVIHSREDVVRFLFDELGRRCAAGEIMGCEVDVSAHAPRMQRTLLELGYLPSAYVPAMAFHDVERLDVVKMYRLFEDLRALPFDAPEPTLSVGRHVLGQFAARQILPRLARAVGELDICGGLTGEQSTRLLREFRSGAFDEGQLVFEQGASPDEMFLVLDGRARVIVDGREVGSVGPGECLGEVSFLNRSAHSATVVADSDLEVGILTQGTLSALVRRRPDIGIVVYRNLARGLGEKLLRADRAGSPASAGPG